MIQLRHSLLALLLLILCGGCTEEETDGQAETVIESLPQFTQLKQDKTGLDFSNDIEEKPDLNYFIHSGFYNGAGLAAADFDNDGLEDLFFCGNQVRNELYLNKGGLQFEKITDRSGLKENVGWCTGVSTVDINGDGFLDIYVCRYFSPDDQSGTANLLYINNGDLTFTEKASEYGIADPGNSVQATFTDYDLDGDLDLYVLNQPTGFRAQKAALIPPNGWKDSDRLYRNEGNGEFTDVSKEAGVLNFGYGLSVVVGDIDNNGYPDLFVSNDYDEPDFLYFNDGRGHFSRVEDYVFKHISNFSMGADIADFNNDGWLDIFVADMLAPDHYRQKTNMGAMNEANFWAMVDQGNHYQYMRNMLHLNNKVGSFSEIGQLAGVSKTDWSWAALFADFDNDGGKDLFVTNGILRDVRNNDAQRIEVENTLAHTRSFPSQPTDNAMFRNQQNLTFENVANDWGIDNPGFSNGAIYADLDADGDLDLVTNNVNAPASLYENNSPNNLKWLQIRLKGQAKNPRGRGAKITVVTNEGSFYQEQTIERGYLSGVSGILHFGLGTANEIIRIEAVWPGGKKQVITDIKLNSRLIIREKDANENWQPSLPPNPSFIPRNEALGIDWTHQENAFNDFEQQVLLPHQLSTLGPGIAVGDVNQDGNDDFYIGGAAGQSGVLFTNQENGKYQPQPIPAFSQDKYSEDMGALFADFDGDQDLDLYVVSGGNSFAENDPLLQDRIYLNDGQGNFSRDSKRLPKLRSSGSCVLATDYDADGDLDLFVGGRLQPGRYPLAPQSYLLENNNGFFTDVTLEKAPQLQQIGMVSGGLWSDYNNDNHPDLILVGEWMPVTVFQNQGDKLTILEDTELGDQLGWWNSIVGGDFDKDGDMDYIVGNQGLNTKYHISQESPLELYSHDFDQNKARDIVLATQDHGVSFPVRGRECSSQQVPEIEEQFKDYNAFAGASLVDIYSSEKLDSALHFKATTFATSFIRNNQGDQFEIVPLPIEAQFSTTFGLLANDFDLDGSMDLLLTGNFYAPEVETGRQDAGIGVFLKGDGKGGFTYLDPLATGFLTPNDARSMAMLYDGAFPLILIGNNDGALETFAYVNGTGKGSHFLEGEFKAEMHFKDGSVQQFENYLGAGYLSSSSSFIQLVPNAEKLVFYKVDGSRREIE